MTDDKQSLGDKLKGGFGTVGKLAVFTGLVGAATIKKIKDTIVGDPPSPWRKGLVFGSAALALGYTACEDEIDSAGQRTYTYLEGQQAQRVEELEENLADTRRRNDSLATRTRSLEGEIQDLTGAYQNSLDSLTAEEQDLQQQLDSLLAAYQAQNDSNAYVVETNRSQPSTDTVIVQNHTEITLEEDTETFHHGSNRQGRPRASQEGCWHPVQDGETLSELSDTYNGSPEEYMSLAATNNIDDADDVPIGFPLQLNMEPCPATTTQPPRYTTMHRNQANVTADLASITDNPEDVLAYNQRRGNPLQESEVGEEIAVYLP
jgi:TolA-binding protein